MKYLKKFFADVGITYTDASKSSKVQEYVKFEELTYLKRRFETRGGWTYAPLPLDNIVEALMWTRKPHNIEDERAGIRSALIEATHLGEHAYKTVLAKYAIPHRTEHCYTEVYSKFNEIDRSFRANVFYLENGKVSSDELRARNAGSIFEVYCKKCKKHYECRTLDDKRIKSKRNLCFNSECSKYRKIDERKGDLASFCEKTRVE
jgi:hypothetical protein